MLPNPWETSSLWESQPPWRVPLKEFLHLGSFFFFFIIRTYFLTWRITTGCYEDDCVCILSLKLSFLSLVPYKQMCSKVMTDIKGLYGKTTLSLKHVAVSQSSWCNELTEFFFWDWFNSDYILNYWRKSVIILQILLLSNNE